MLEYIEYIKNNKLGVIELNKSFKNMTTLKIGGKIKLLFYPYTNECFINFYRYYINNKKYPLFVIGNGSNIFASSKDYNGIVVCFKKMWFKYGIYNNQLLVNSGVMLMDLINYLKNINLGGFEKLAYIPATIGGMVMMNAGAYKVDISDLLISIKCIDNKGEVIIYNKKEINFSYRKSNLNNVIILECVFEVKNINKININNTIEWIKDNRTLKQPIESNNAGSTFKNYENKSSWKLIDEIGFRGYNINDAYVSSKHCNFLINKKDCTSDDMLSLINLINNKIYDKYGHKLDCEWIFINF